MANAGGTDSNDTQFFITTGSPNQELGYNYTIFGQMVPNPTSASTLDQTTLAKLTQIPVTTNPNLGNEDSLPVNAPTFTSVTISPTDTTTIPAVPSCSTPAQATSGETGHDHGDGHGSDRRLRRSPRRSLVTVGAYAGPTDPAINFVPFANPTTASVAAGPVHHRHAQRRQRLSGYQQAIDVELFAGVPAGGRHRHQLQSIDRDVHLHAECHVHGHRHVSVPGDGHGPESTPATTHEHCRDGYDHGRPGTAGRTRAPSGSSVRCSSSRRCPRSASMWKNTIDVVQVPSTATSTTPVIEVFVNGQLDATQPQTAISTVSVIDDIIVFGRKGQQRDHHRSLGDAPGRHRRRAMGARNGLQGGWTETLEHGWFGHNVMIGGSGPNQLIGRAGHVKFKPSKATDLIFAGQPKRRTPDLQPDAAGRDLLRLQEGPADPRAVEQPVPRTSSTIVSKPVGATHHKK